MGLRLLKYVLKVNGTIIDLLCSLDCYTSKIEYGSDSVEVIDDGSGISPSNFENLCLKHYTSKIQEFEDLLNVQTFGFRGEALSSLCALSTLSVTTCEKNSKIGWKLEYEMFRNILVHMNAHFLRYSCFKTDMILMVI